jgi:hypothetical protein
MYHTLGLHEGNIICAMNAIEASHPNPLVKAVSLDVNLLGGDKAPSSVCTTPSPGPPSLFIGPGDQLENAQRGRPTPSMTGSTAPGTVDPSTDCSAVIAVLLAMLSNAKGGPYIMTHHWPIHLAPPLQVQSTCMIWTMVLHGLLRLRRTTHCTLVHCLCVGHKGASRANDIGSMK